MTEIIKLKPSEILVQEGDHNTDLFIVHKGRLEIVQNRGTYEIHLDEIGEGEIIGEISAIDHQPRSATIRSLGDSEVLKYSTAEIKNLLNAQPALIRDLLETLVDRLRKTSKKLK